MNNKICFIITDAVSLNVLYKGQLEYLADRDCELTLICGGDYSDLNILRKRNVGKVINLGFVRQPSILLDLVCLFKVLWHLLFNRYDLVVSTTPKALLIGSLAAFLTCQRRRVSFFQGRVYENFIGFKRTVFTFLDRVVIACSQESIFVSKSLMDAFSKDISAVGKKGKVIGSGSGNGVCPEVFSLSTISISENNKLLNRLGIKNTDFVVLSVGRICNDKGLKELAEVARNVTEKNESVRFLMLGSIEDNQFFEFFSDLIECGAVIHVDFANDIEVYFALADIHLFLSHREGFGNVAIEAASMNVPTIAFDVVGVRDSVADGVSGLRFKFGDSESVANTIIKFSRDPDAMKEQFKGARAWVMKKFSKENVWKNYESFYKEEY